MRRALAAAEEARAQAASLGTERASLQCQIDECRRLLAEAERRVAEADPFRAAFDASAQAMVQAELASRRLLRANAAFRALLGLAEAGAGPPEGADLLDMLHPEDREAGEAVFRHLGEGHGHASAELRWRHRDGEAIQARLDLTRVEVAPGRPAQAFAVLRDIAGERAMAERQALLAREMDHRAKNLLAIMQSIIRLTRAADLEGYRKAIEGRIGAVARAHSLLPGGRFEGAQLRRLVEEELAPYAGLSAGRIRIAGPELPLAPEAVQALAMALHELATNAAKYGALSAPGGSLAVEWELAEAGTQLRLRWTERGGPPVPATQARRGFGSRLILATIEEQLGGWVVKDWQAEGLRCEIGVPAGRSIVDAG